MADALVVAGVAGGEAWARAQREYFQRCPRPYMRLVAAIQDNDFLGEPALALLPPSSCPGRQVERMGLPSRPCHWQPRPSRSGTRGPLGAAPGALGQRSARPEA